MSTVKTASSKVKTKKTRTNKSLTLRERRFIAALPHSTSYSEAMKKAGYAKSTIDRGFDGTCVRNPRVLSAMQAAMHAAGISEASLAEKIKEGLNATRVIVASENGIITDEKYYKDYAVQHKYLDTAHKLRADYPSERLEVEHTGQVEVLHIPIKGQGWE
jgi:hypothetical protein